MLLLRIVEFDHLIEMRPPLGEITGDFDRSAHKAVPDVGTVTVIINYCYSCSFRLGMRRSPTLRPSLRRA